MSYSEDKAYSENRMEEFVALLERHAPTEGFHQTSLYELVTFREEKPKGMCASVYEPGIVILGQGKKQAYLDGRKYDYSVGNYLSLYMPMPIDVEVVEASPEKPLLMIGLRIDLIKIADILSKIDRAGGPLKEIEPADTSAIFSRPMTDNMLDPVIKLLRVLDDPVEMAVLSDSILEEIYFRLILDDHSGSLRRLLRHHGQIQQISRAVEHMRNNLDEMVSVDELASLVNMSSSGFRKMFRDVMHMPPLQYAKALKLNHAQTLILDGKNASEAGYMVGYNSPAQFSREYKRRFGYSPSATLAAV
jgi:AraC-like DNA-binding protein